MRESEIEKYLVDSVKALGGECRKLKWAGRTGAPDRLVMLPGHCLWVEVKATGKAVKPHQLREHERMRVMGLHVEIVDSFERVGEVLA